MIPDTRFGFDGNKSKFEREIFELLSMAGKGRPAVAWNFELPRLAGKFKLPRLAGESFASPR